MTEVEALLRAGRPIREIYYTERFAESAKGLEFLKTRNEDGRVFIILGSEAFSKASYQNNSDGVLAVAECWNLDLPAVSGLPSLVLVLDEIEKPGNMGAILRTAEVFGVSNIVLSEPVLDFFNPNALRSSRGLMARMQVSVGTKEEVHSWLEQAGLRIVGSSSKSSKSYWDLQLSGGLLLFWEAKEKAWVYSGRSESGNGSVFR